MEGRDLLGTPTASEAAQAILTGRLPKRMDAAGTLTSKSPEQKMAERFDKLKYARLDDEPVILGYLADDKTYVSRKSDIVVSDMN